MKKKGGVSRTQAQTKRQESKHGGNKKKGLCSLSHSTMSVWSWYRAPMEICLTSGSSRSCIREVEMCLQADMQAVWATFPYRTHTYAEKRCIVNRSDTQLTSVDV